MKLDFIYTKNRKHEEHKDVNTQTNKQHKDKNKTNCILNLKFITLNHYSHFGNLKSK